MRIVLTGSQGMVGRNIVDLRPDYINLLTPAIAELDLLDFDAVYKYLKQHQPEMVIHAAGIVGGIQANINHPVRFLRENTLMAHNLIWAAHEAEVPYFLNLGSSCMFPRQAVNPLKEELILTGELEPTNEGYALAKIFAQRFCQYINQEQNQTNYKTIIPCNLFGKYDKFDSEWGHMIPAVISKIHHAKLQNAPVVNIWGDGEARREFMYTVDLADFIWFAVANPDSIPALLNVGLGRDFSINEYYQIIANEIGFTGSFVHDLSKPVGMKQKLVDNTKLLETGWKPTYSLEEGIGETYLYYLTHVLKQ